MPIKIELLAPAKNYDTGKIAVDSGADAVYIAAHRFGAREAAGNTMGDIERMVQYAHRYYAKVYLTLNTVLFDRELEHARKLVHDAYNVGCDAVIVQDMALLEMDLPPIPLHASTQTHNTTPEKVKFLQDVGFQRVILARELSLQQIAAIRAQATVPLESFVHGALCVSYSGQCYLSCAVAGRSANRGVCAQPCRATYNLIDAAGKTLLREKHLLSLRDMQRSHALHDMMQAGITSFKIEGRLKNESYVKNVVSHYRQHIDTLLDGINYTKESSGKSIYTFTPQPENTFSRGFSEYFIHGERQKMASFNTAKAIGQEVGRVIAINGKEVVYEGEKDLHNADGICFFDAREKLCGAFINKITGNRIGLTNTQGLQVGAILYRNHDHEFEKQLQQPVERKITATVYFEVDAEEILITVKDEDGVEVTLHEENTFSQAENISRNLDNIVNALQKTGGTPFEFRVVSINNPNDVYFPLSTLNAMRRSLVDALAETREILREKSEATIVPNNLPYPAVELDYRANITNALSEQFYRHHGVQKIHQAFEIEKPAKAELMRTKYCLKFEMGYCPKQTPAQKLQEPLFLLNNGLRLQLSFDCTRCEMVIS